MERPTLVVEAPVASVPDGQQAIHDLNLDKIRAKLQKPSPRGKGWTPEQAATADKWYRRFLTIGLKNPGVTLVPNEEVDEIWHAHVLDMKKYEEDTKRIFGKILYHVPSFGEIDLRPQFKVTNDLLREEFGEDLATSGDYEPQSCCCMDDS